MSLRVLGVDPGLTRCGVGIVDVATNRSVQLVAVEVIRTSPELELVDRIKQVSDGVERMISAFSPSSIAIERVFAQQNLRTVMGVAQASGVVMLAAANHNLPVGLHTPTEVKAALTGFGKADKRQLGTMVAKLLGLDEIPKPADASDALALAICHGWKSAVAGSSQANELTPAQQKWRAAESAAAKSKVNSRLKA